MGAPLEIGWRNVVFEGSKGSRLDEKGRMPVPAVFRSHLDPMSQGALVLTRGFDGCMLVYPPQQWAKRREDLLALADHDYESARGRRLLRFLSRNTEYVSSDSQGRILVPDHLRAYADLDHQVLVVGVGRHLEVWDPARYDAYESDLNQENFEDLAQEFLHRARREESRPIPVGAAPAAEGGDPGEAP